MAELTADSEVRASSPKMRNIMASMTLAYVRRALGEDAVAQVLEEVSGRDTDGHELDEWLTREHTLAIAGAAARVCGDLDIGRHVGAEHMETLRGGFDILRATGSVEAALRMVADAGSKVAEGRAHKVVAAGPGHATIECPYEDAGNEDPFFCGYAAGCFRVVPELFGFDAVVTEPRCMCRGDDVCTFELRWTPGREGASAVDESDMAASRDRVAGFLDRFEQLHTMATELAQAEDVDTVLARITERASFAVKARRHLLAIRTEDEGPIRVHHRGFQDEEVEAFAEHLLAGELGDDWTYIVAEVASATRAYGRLVAVYPPGLAVTEPERRLLDAYARHAAAALEAVASLERARADRDAAEALLDLAGSLAQVGSTTDVAERLAASVPRVAACDRVDVWLWDAASEGLRLTAVHDERKGADCGVGNLLPADGYAEVLEHAASPFIVGIDQAASVVGKLMDSARIRRLAVVPIRARGDFLGAVAAGYAADGDEDHGDADAELLHRLGGMADQAATALDNAALLDRIRQQALHDALTGLPNRTLIEERTRQVLADSDADGKPTSLLFVDLDRFKNVNDTLGHDAGDELIRQVGARLGACIRKSDTLARIGGDEFVVLLAGTDQNDAEQVASKVLHSLRATFVLDEDEVHISCSIGIAVAPTHGEDYSTLLRHADAAMYRAKEAGRSGFAVHAPTSSTAKRQRLSLEAELHGAMDRDELRVLYQPQIETGTLRVVGAEALVRWDHRTLGRLTPDQFLPLAEQSGLIAEIDEWVRETSFGQVREWQSAGLDLRVSVNLSTRALHDPLLVRQVAQLLDRHQLDPSMIELEVTDRVVMEEDDLPAVLAPLHALGVRLAIDDFGIGSSVMGRLQRCPVDTVKIDRSFIQSIRSPNEDAPVVTALLAMAAGLDLDVVAEGVETTAQAAFMHRHGCRLIQGFYFSKPVEAKELGAFVRRQRGERPSYETRAGAGPVVDSNSF